MGCRESIIAGAILAAIRYFAIPRKLGIVMGEAGPIRLMPGLVRIPDVTFVSKSRLPGGHVPVEPMPHLIPDLAVEVLSQSNTKAEMSRKLREYFEAGVRIVWFIDPATRSATVYSSPSQSVTLNSDQNLDGGDVLPGFVLPLAEVFAELD